MLFVVACGSDEPARGPATSGVPTAPQQATPPAAAPPQVIEVTLSFIEPRFRPERVLLQVGVPVQFKLTSADTRHTFVVEPLGIDVEVPQKSLNETVTTQVVTPQQAGTFRVFCRLHGRLPMEGTVEVTAPGTTGN